MKHDRIAFVGAGQMATALAGGFLAAGLVRAEGISASDPAAGARAAFAQATGGAAVEESAAAVRDADVVFLAVKPQHAAEALRAIRGAMPGKLLVSIVAGIPLATIFQGLGGAETSARLVRVMPNTPCLVRQGASAYCLGPGATPDDGALTQRLLSAVGKWVELPERLLDAVTGLSGSGPAFVMLMIEALADGGVKMGLPRDAALLLAAQTLRGAAELLLETGLHPGKLKDQVASPAGTTIAGLHVLEQGGLRGILISAVEAAALRARELARES